MVCRRVKGVVKHLRGDGHEAIILGGTQFVRRHIVEAALAAGHGVTRSGADQPDLFPEAEHLYGDREADLSPLADRR